MANHSQQESTTSSFVLFSPPECISWITVFGIQAFAIVLLNALVIIICLRQRSLRKRSMYLVINLAVADMSVGGSAICYVLDFGIMVWRIDDQHIKQPFLSYLYCSGFLTSRIDDKPCCYFFGADACNVSSIEAPPRQKESIWSSCCSRLDNTCASYSNLCPSFLPRNDQQISPRSRP